jgi:uncharacterized protein (DUF488 family)
LFDAAVKRSRAKQTIWTIGHSTRPIEEFLEILSSFRIENIADVRRFPGSRNSPQYGQERLAAVLASNNIGYVWLEALGGRRRPLPDSPNTAWRNAAFRGYADYMSSMLFEEGFTQLLETANASRTAIMCAEAVWWRCHRSLIADALCVRGIEVVHIMDAKHSTVHPMTKPARVVDGRLTYALPEQQSFL